ATARRRYDALRRRGHGHARTLRTVGDRLLYALCTTLERQTPYNPNYQTAQVTAAPKTSFLCSTASGHSFVPTCRSAERRAQMLSRMPVATGADRAPRPGQRPRRPLA